MKNFFSRTSDWKSGNTAPFFKAGNGDKTPTRAKVDFALKMFVGVRGPECLKNTATAVVMRENGECFVTQDVAGVDVSDGIQSVVYLRDLESIGRFNKTYGDSFLRSSAIGQMALNELADEIVNQIVIKRGAQA